jgi:hypothetical protein
MLGTATDNVARDGQELPAMIDLHLFLGVPLRSTPVDHGPNEALYGRIPQVKSHS